MSLYSDPSSYALFASPCLSSLESGSTIDNPIRYSTGETKPSLDLWTSRPRAPKSSAYDASHSRQLRRDSTKSTDHNGLRRKKSVRFSRRLTQTESYIHVEEYTLEEKEACWYPIWGM